MHFATTLDRWGLIRWALSSFRYASSGDRYAHGPTLSASLAMLFANVVAVPLPLCGLPTGAEEQSGLLRYLYRFL